MKKVWFLLGWVIVVLMIGCQGEIFTGTMIVNSLPQGADVYLDDSLTGQTNCIFEDVESGSYLLRLKLEGYSDWKDTVVVEKDDTIVVDVDLSALGKIFIHSTPQGAQIHLDDSLTGKTTDCVLEHVLPGERKIELTLEGHWAWEGVLDIEPDEVETLTIVLQEVVEIKWKYETGGAINSSPAIADDGTIYCSSADKYLYALNPDGSLKWNYRIYYPYPTPAIGSDGTIYWWFFAINPVGALKWKYEPNSSLGCEVGSTPAIGADGTIYVASDYSREKISYLFALNQDATLKWLYADTLPESRACYSAPVIDAEGTIYISASDRGTFGYLYALNPDGSLKWRYEIDNPITSIPAIGSDGTVYFGSNDSYLYALNPDGSLRWRFQSGGTASSPAIGTDGTLYVGGCDVSDGNGYLYAIYPDGTLKWKFLDPTFYQCISSSPAIDSDGNIYYGASGYIYAVRPDGTLKWWVNTSGASSTPSSPAIAADGTLYIGDGNGTIYAVQGANSGLASSPWPKFRGNNQNTGRAQ